MNSEELNMNSSEFDPQDVPFFEAPQSYHDADPLEIFKLTNGCGSSEAKFDFVPDHIWGLPIGEACNIHDWCYHFGQIEDDRKDADDMLLRNLLKLVEQKSCWLLKYPRRLRCMTYYSAVRDFGAEAFWADKLGPRI
jgi:hypothetical protein